MHEGMVCTKIWLVRTRGCRLRHAWRVEVVWQQNAETDGDLMNIGLDELDNLAKLRHKDVAGWLAAGVAQAGKIVAA